MRIISGDKVIYGFDNKMDEVARVTSNEKIVVETNDCFFQQIKTEEDLVEELDTSRLNPATGPIYVEGAEVGDILRVDILDIEVASRGVSLTIPEGGLLGDLVKEPLTKIIKIEGDRALMGKMSFKIQPMIGVIGVATRQEDGFIATSTPHKHGGNMDTKDIRKGTSLYFPVATKGALLALGDLHALMGDGEICFTGLEIPGRVTLNLDIIKSKTIEWPILETEDSIMIIASGKTLEDASYLASKEIVTYLAKGLNISFEEAYILASLNMDLKISQIVNPLVTVRASISKDILNLETLLRGLDQ